MTVLNAIALSGGFYATEADDLRSRLAVTRGRESLNLLRGDYRVAIIRAGHIVAIERIVDLKAQARRVIEVTFESPVPMNEFDGLGSVADIAALPDGRSLSFTVVGSMDELVKALARHPVRNLVSSNGNLEDVFLEFYSEAGGSDAQ